MSKPDKREEHLWTFIKTSTERNKSSWINPAQNPNMHLTKNSYHLSQNFGLTRKCNPNITEAHN